MDDVYEYTNSSFPFWAPLEHLCWLSTQLREELPLLDADDFCYINRYRSIERGTSVHIFGHRTAHGTLQLDDFAWPYRYRGEQKKRGRKPAHPNVLFEPFADFGLAFMYLGLNWRKGDDAERDGYMSGPDANADEWEMPDSG